ncbi:MAG: hypothetical protein Kow0029_28090 [Candidatus Rifleibacteriota bacterium]
MDKMNKDQFEKYLAENAPTEEPSVDVFNALQKQAEWNQPAPRPGVSIMTIAAITIIIIASTIFFLAYSAKPQAPLSNKVPEELPEIIEPQPAKIIAQNEDIFDIGAYKLIKFKNEDFNLSFAQDNSNTTMLGFARELNNI